MPLHLLVSKSVTFASPVPSDFAMSPFAIASYCLTHV
jgi:hypothetical protein